MVTDPVRRHDHVRVPDTFRAMPRWWHDDAGLAWLDELPMLVEARCRAWGVEVDGPPMHGSHALVMPVRRGAEQFALRMSPPGDDLEREARALRFWDGRGTVHLLEADLHGRAMLLERLDGAQTLRSLPVMQSLEVSATLIRTLAVPPPEGVPTTWSIAAALEKSFEADWEALGEPVPRRHLTSAVSAAAELSTASAEDVAVDGDLHSGQVLAGRRTPWIVVDPVLLRGDPEYDWARVLWSRLDEVDDAGLGRSLGIVVRGAGVPAERARAWLVVRSLDYLLWGLRHGLTEDPPRCRRLLDAFG